MVNVQMLRDSRDIRRHISAKSDENIDMLRLFSRDGDYPDASN